MENKFDEQKWSDFEDDSEVPRICSNDEKIKYLKLCEKYSVAQISIFTENIDKEDLNMAHRGIGYKSMKAITSSLMTNRNIVSVDFTDNNLHDTGIILVAKIFRQNWCIQKLALANNHITHKGLSVLLRTLESNRSLIYLNVADNLITDTSAEIIKDFLVYNDFVKEFDLSGNQLCSGSTSLIREGIEYNSTLEILNLSWNHIRCDGATEISKGFMKNISIKKLNLAWNGFADENCIHMGKALSVNDDIEEIDLSHNRIGNLGAVELAKGLLSNKTLKILRLGWNNLKPEGINEILNALMQNEKSKIISLHFEEMHIDKSNQKNIEMLMDKIPDIEVTIGGYTSDSIEKMDETAMRRELLNILKKYLVEHRLRMVDLFNMWDKDKSFSITREEFVRGIRSCKIPLSKSQMNYLVNWLDSDGSNDIEYQEFVGITEIE